MRVLFLCNKSPWPPKEGGPMAMNMLIGGLIREGHQVKVLAVNSFKYNIHPGDIPVPYIIKTGIELIDVDLRLKPLDALTSLILGESYHVRRFVSATFRKRLIEILKGDYFDIVQLETLYMGSYIDTIRSHSRAKIVLRAHNIEHVIWQRIAEETKQPLKKWYISRLAEALKHYEQQTVFAVDGVMAITETDAAYFRGVTEEVNSKSKTQRAKFKFGVTHHSGIRVFGYSSIPVIALPFGINPDDYPQNDSQTEFPSLFSLGSMNWIPNQEGIRWFLEKVWTEVHLQFPDLKYYIAGRGMPDWMRSLDLPNVLVMGEVDDAKKFLASKSIMIVPIFSGSGIRVKIIEGMAAGKTIISTSTGAEGIRYEHRLNILIADTPCDFFEMISLSVSNPDLCAKTGSQARELAINEYNSAIIIRKMTAFYQQLTG